MFRSFANVSLTQLPSTEAVGVHHGYSRRLASLAALLFVIFLAGCAAQRADPPGGTVLDGITLTPNPAPPLTPGLSAQFIATGHYSDGSAANLTNSAGWNSSDTRFAIVDSTGKVTAVAPGTAMLTAASGGVTSPTVPLTVTSASLQSIIVTPNPAPSIAAGLTEQFIATGHYSDGSTANLSSTAAWNSSSTNFATINSLGLATGVAPGNSTITAASNGVTSPGITLAITAAVLQSVTVTPNPAPSVTAGLTEQFTATGHYSDGSSMNLTSTATWNSSNTNFVTINSAGLAAGVAAGNSTITAASNGVISPGITLAISAAVLQSIVVTPNPAPSIAAGITEQFTATGHYSDGSTANLTNSASWNSTNTAFVTINSTGLATAVASGSSTITAALNGVTSSPGISLAVIAAQPVAPSLRASANGRYLVDQNGSPVYVIGDSPHSLLENLDPTTMASYMADRQARGFNAVLVQVLCNSYTGGNSSGTTYDGVAPFNSGNSPSNYDLSQPNSAYFARLDSLIALAAKYNLTVFLDPIDTGGWLTTLENNGPTRAFNYGAFLGSRYSNSPNIVWDSGNDFNDWNTNAGDNNLVRQLMAGISSTDTNHLQTIELNALTSYSSQDAMLVPFLTLNSAYTYYPTYDMVLQAYNSGAGIPVFMTEANYEYENDTGGLPGPATAFVLREQEYWTLFSGGTSQLYGNRYTWTFDGPEGVSNWQNFLDSPGAMEIQYLTGLLQGVSWWNLVPDTAHVVVTAGYGSYDASSENLATNTYAPTAWVTDGSLALTYDVTGSAVKVNMAVFRSGVTVRWYDPTNGNYTTIAGSPFANNGSMVFTPPGANSTGDADWVLMLQAGS
jgi:hypothetical protein